MASSDSDRKMPDDDKKMQDALKGLEQATKDLKKTFDTLDGELACSIQTLPTKATCKDAQKQRK